MRRRPIECALDHSPGSTPPLTAHQHPPSASQVQTPCQLPCCLHHKHQNAHIPPNSTSQPPTTSVPSPPGPYSTYPPLSLFRPTFFQHLTLRVFPRFPPFPSLPTSLPSRIITRDQAAPRPFSRDTLKFFLARRCFAHDGVARSTLSSEGIGMPGMMKRSVRYRDVSRLLAM